MSRTADVKRRNERETDGEGDSNGEKSRPGGVGISPPGNETHQSAVFGGAFRDFSDKSY